MAESNFERFRRQMETMQFETLPLFSKPHLFWKLRTDYVGRRLFYRPSSGSTMEDARNMLQRWRAASGGLVLAETQSAGRGRNGRGWVSPPDVNLYFTVILMVERPETARALAYVTPLAVARAVEEVCEAQGVPLRSDLKWPNDVLVGDRKLAGVLIETTTNDDGILVALVGVGLNVNLDVGDYPEIAGIATSLKQELGFSVSREEVMAAFCNHFESLWEQAASGDKAPFDEWRSRLVTLGREVVATATHETLRGIAVDVAEDGALIIELAGGRRVSVEAADVTLSAGS